VTPPLDVPRQTPRALWVTLIFALIAGVVGAFAQAPFENGVFIIVMMLAAFFLHTGVVRGWHAALLGLTLGFGYFVVTLSWIISPFQVDPTTVWMAPFGLVFMALGMGLFWAFGFWGATILRRPWALIVTWTLAEMLRAYLFTGFAWGSPPQALVDMLGGQALAYVGPHGVMLALCVIGWVFSRNLPRFRLVQGLAFFVSVVVILMPAAWVTPQPLIADRPVVRLVQPNAPQTEKWNADTAWKFVRRSLDYTAAAGDVDLILWPETSVPSLLHNAQNVMQAVGEAGGDTTVALGILRERDDGMLANSMVVLDGAGAVTQTYDKHHIVPFGEYIPLRWAFNAIGLNFVGDMFGDGFGRGEGAKLLDFGALGKALPLICYEAVFAHDVGAAPARPDFLIQITNDAWFGDFAGPQQHLAQARMRAIEQGLPMARAANTGISAMIGPHGHIIASVALNKAGYVDAPLPAPLAPTLYSKTGDRPLGAVLIMLVLMCLLFAARRPKAN
jgi:apolipoprotein N-acyltransferase